MSDMKLQCSRRNSKGEALAFDSETFGNETQFEEKRQPKRKLARSAEAEAESGSTLKRRRNSKGEALAFDRDSLIKGKQTGTEELQFEENRAIFRADHLPVFISTAEEEPTTKPKTPMTRKSAISTTTAMATPTVHTKLAMDEVLSMFNDPVTPGPTPGRPLLPIQQLNHNQIQEEEEEQVEIFDEGIESNNNNIQPISMAPSTTNTTSGIVQPLTERTLSKCRVSNLPPPPETNSIFFQGGIVDPFSDEHQRLILEALEKTNIGKLEGIVFKHGKGKKAPKLLTSPNSLLDRGAIIELEGSGKFDVDCCGMMMSNDNEEQNTHSFKCIHIGDTQDPPIPLELKVSIPPTTTSYGEWYISNVIKQRIPQESQHLFIKYEQVHFFEDASVLISPFNQCGTLQRAIRAHQKTGRRMEETLCMYYTIEILRIVSALHSANIIHADIKPENFLVVSEMSGVDSTWGDWTIARSRGGWEGRGLKISDYSHSIDRNLFPSGTLFSGKCNDETFVCANMRNGMPWGFQIDTHGIAVTVHCMLFGTWLQVIPKENSNNNDNNNKGNKTGNEKKQQWKIKEELKKFWQQQLWNELFDVLLNADEEVSLDKLREKFEAFLEKDPRRSREIRTLLSRQDVLLAEVHDDTTD